MSNANTISSRESLGAEIREENTSFGSHDDLIYASAELSLSEDENWVLDLLSTSEDKPTKPAVNRKPIKQVASLPSEDKDDIEIPAIFLTQGAKNARLLRQSKEIDRQMVEDEEKMRAQAEELRALQEKILTEINDNGSQFIYSHKNDSELIEKYVLKHYSKDQTLMTHRHFFYFEERKNVDLPTYGESVLSLVFTSMTPLLNETDHMKLLEILRHNNISMENFVNYVLTTVTDETLLDLAERFLHSVSFKTEKHVSSDVTIDTYMETLGAVQADVTPLKLVHYNNNPRALILRLCIAFHFVLMTNEDITAIVNHYILAMSDFILNKREKSLLIEKFICPVFDRLLLKCESSEKLATLLDSLLNLIDTRIYADKTEIISKKFEIQFNVLNALWTCFCNHQGDSGEVTTMLILRFLKFDESQTPTYQVLSLVDVVNEIGQSKISHPNLSSIHKNVYRAKLVVILLTRLVYDQQPKQKNEYFVLSKAILDCKDRLQESIGKLLFMNSESIPDKVPISMALSETYHVIDHFSVVLDKNLIFLKRDLFYDET